MRLITSRAAKRCLVITGQEFAKPPRSALPGEFLKSAKGTSRAAERIRNFAKASGLGVPVLRVFLKRVWRAPMCGMLTVALLIGFSGSSRAQSETPLQRQERLQREAEERAERQREAQERAERQREAQERAEQQREAQERAQRQREEQQQRLEQQREAQQRAEQQREAAERAQQQREAQQRIQQQREAAERAEQQREYQRRAEQQQQREVQPRAEQPRPSTPTPSYTRPSYTAGESNSGGTGRATGAYGSSGGPTVYTPGARTSEPSSKAVTRSNGVTTYTPHAAGSSGSVPAASHSGSTGLRPAYTAPAPLFVASRTASGSVLTQSGSQRVLQELNQARPGLRGVNGKPLPPGTLTVHSNNSLTLQTTNGMRFGLRPDGTVASYALNGNTAAFRPNGGVSAIHTATVDIRTGVHGDRRIVTRQPNGSVLVSTGPNRGYLQHSVVVSGRTVVVRTHPVGGYTYNSYLLNYHMGTTPLLRYVPAVTYNPAYFGWIYFPWLSPATYSWGFTGDQWFQASAGYFSPSPSYAGACAWLTDYLLSQTLSSAYADRMATAAEDFADAPADPTGAEEDLYASSDTPIDSDLKAEIAEEVQRQVAVENATQSGTAPVSASELPAALKPKRIFVVSESLDVTTADQQGCGLSGGDILRMETPPSAGSSIAALRVAASRQLDCPAGELVSVDVHNLQEWQNDMRSQIDSGLAEMRTAQGTGGLPSAPSDAVAPPPRPSMAGLPAATGAGLGAMLEAQRRDAKQVEVTVLAPALGANQ